MRKKINIVAATLLTIFLFTGCATYYQRSFEFQQQFAVGDLESAKAFLEKNKKAAEKKDRLLYFLDRGVVEQMLGNYQESNFYFEEAYKYNQDFTTNFGNNLVGLIANPMLKPYKAEDFEVVLIHFYKAINYIQLGSYDEALVEVKRVNISLNELNDKYEGKKNRYKEDAFAHMLMGIIYEAKKSYNDAFIAYRNAYNVYQGTYNEEFQVQAPLQLKKDLLRMAKKNGFRQELKDYESEFGFSYESESKESGELVFFWMNGLGPVKSEFSLNLSAVRGEGGFFTFANEQEGFSIPYTENEAYYSSSPSEFGDLKFVRMAIPKYKVRAPLVNEAFITLNGVKIPLEKAEDINEIAFSTLQDRMLREVAQSVGRLALKQAAELVARNENEDLGALVSAFNAVTEKADTRNWQTLPHSIYYQRVTLAVDTHRLQLVTKGADIPTDTLSFKVKIEEGKTLFRTFHSLESSLPMNKGQQP